MMFDGLLLDAVFFLSRFASSIFLITFIHDSKHVTGARTVSVTRRNTTYYYIIIIGFT